MAVRKSFRAVVYNYKHIDRANYLLVNRIGICGGRILGRNFSSAFGSIRKVFIDFDVSIGRNNVYLTIYQLKI